MYMGLLDRLINKIGEVVGEEAKEGLQKAFGSGQRPAGQTGSADTDHYSNTDGQQAFGDGYYDFDGRPLADKLYEVLRDEFPEYVVNENVSPETLGGTGRFMRYSYGVYKDGQPKLFIMIINNNTCAMREYRWSKEQAEKAGVTLINFRLNEPNSVMYIRDRLHKYL